jgi:hypothetical protein
MVAKVNTSTEDEEISASGDSESGVSDGGGPEVGGLDDGGSGSSNSEGTSKEPSIIDRIKDTVTNGVPFAGGNITPAKIGGGYGAKWTMKFSEGGKVSQASKRADGIAQRGKTKGRYL